MTNREIFRPVMDAARAIEARNPLPLCDENGWYTFRLSPWAIRTDRDIPPTKELKLGTLGTIILKEAQ